MAKVLTGQQPKSGRELVVLHVAPHLKQGGAERMLHLVASSGAPGYRHHVALMQDEIFFDCSSFDVTPLGFDLTDGTRALSRLPKAVVELRRLVKQVKPDVIQGWIYYGNLLTLGLLGAGAPIIWSIHNSTLPAWRDNAMLRLADRTLAAMSGQVPQRIVYCAESARAQHESTAYAACHGSVIPNGVDTSVFRPDDRRREAVRARLGLHPAQLAIGLFARNNPQKNIAGAFDAFAAWSKGRDARFVLAGGGMNQDAPDLLELARSRGMLDKTMLLGPVPDIEGHLIAMDAVLLSSTYGEALPMVLIEALCAGTPIAATTVGDIARLPAPAAAMVSPGDSEALAGALSVAVGRASAPEWRESFALARERYSLDRCLMAYRSLYAEVAAARPARWPRS